MCFLGGGFSVFFLIDVGGRGVFGLEGVLGWWLWDGDVDGGGVDWWGWKGRGMEKGGGWSQILRHLGFERMLTMI